MTYPTAVVATANLDAGTDSPATARSDLLDAVQKLNQMIAHTTAFAATLLDDTTAAAARTTLGAAESGANTSITSLGAVTGVTATAGDSTTKLATTAFVAGAAIVPTGTIIDFAANTAPAGYLVCPTSATTISRTTYAALFGAIGTIWGAGDGSTTFGMPWFPVDYAGVQASANTGTSTAGAVIAHAHTAYYSGGPGGGSQFPIATISDTTSGGGATSTTGGSANLAAGVRILKCIKY